LFINEVFQGAYPRSLNFKSAAPEKACGFFMSGDEENPSQFDAGQSFFKLLQTRTESASGTA